MYINRLLGRLVIDPIDYFLISALIGNLLAREIKKRTDKKASEKAAMDRLKHSIIKKSRLVSSNSASKSLLFRSAKASKIRGYSKLGLANRGGYLQDIPLDGENDELYRIANFIEKTITKIAGKLKEYELRGILKIIVSNQRLIIELILSCCKITLNYTNIGQINDPRVMVVGLTAGGAMGYSLGWFYAGMIFSSPVFIVSVLIGRSMFQQLKANSDFHYFKQLMTRVLNDEDVKTSIRGITIETADQIIENMKITENLDQQVKKVVKIGIQDLKLNWDENPLIQETAEKLGVFENRLLDDSNGRIGKMLENLGVLEMDIENSEVPSGITNFDSDIVDSTIIDAEIITE